MISFGGLSIVAWPPSIREAIYARLTQFTAVTLNAGPRIFFGALPQTCALGDGPAITYFVSDRPYGLNLTGSNGTSTVHARISTWSYLESDADQLAQAVRDCFDGWSGVHSGIRIMACSLKDERDFPQSPRAGTDQWIYQVTQHYEVAHRVGLPALLGA